MPFAVQMYYNDTLEWWEGTIVSDKLADAPPISSLDLQYIHQETLQRAMWERFIVAWDPQVGNEALSKGCAFICVQSFGRSLEHCISLMQSL